ncbi:hypothetical protein ABH931_004798 [Streptacidiphilus sp. MAP12-33]|uniref:DUF6643 family protein n=1 Tax=Streptacidiphilus sp. MAP12-33 TaxID=3156266 RepID=UPI00351763CE
MTSRSYDGVGYYAPSFASDTPIYDSLVAERGVPQIAPINVPAALPPAGYDSFGSSYGNSYGAGYGSSYGTGSNLPAMPAPRLALGPGPSSPSYGQPQAVPAQYPAPQPYIPQQPQYGGMPSQYSAPVAPVAPLRPAPPQPQYGGYPQQQYPQQRGY